MENRRATRLKLAHYSQLPDREINPLVPRAPRIKHLCPQAGLEKQALEASEAVLSAASDSRPQPERERFHPRSEQLEQIPVEVGLVHILKGELLA